jgi:glucokinase
MTPYVVGIDVGGTSIKSALLSTGLDVLYEQRRPTGGGDGPRTVVANLLDAARLIIDEGDRRYGADPLALGVATLGLVDEAGGIARESAAFGWRDVPLGALLRDVSPAPVAVGHDLRAGALAEARLGAGRGLASFLFVTLGTGVGGAVVIDGVPVTGGFGRAGEIGHLRVRGGTDKCGCGGRGCPETVASATAIRTRFHRRTGRLLSAEDIAGAVRDADPAAMRVWDAAVEALAEALAAAVALVDPAAVIIGGGVSLAGDTLLAPLRTALGRRVTMGAAPPLMTALLGDRAAVIGAGIPAARTAAAARADLAGERRP